MKEMQEIHEKVLATLKKYRKKDPNLFFSLRQSNRYNRLEQGYWFHGNDDYLAVSFWSGRDWKNKTPNIYFEVSRDKQCLFIFSAKDSHYKSQFANEKILPLFKNDFKPFIASTEHHGSENVLIFLLGVGDYEKILNNFIKHIKPRIDIAVRQNRDDYDSYIQSMQEYSEKDDIQGLQEINEIPEGDFIGFIDSGEFQKNYDRVRKYHLKLKLKRTTYKDEFYIKTISIKNAGDIRNILNIEIPKECSWVFLTGENGCGKTTILRAITAFFYKEIKSKYAVVSKANIDIEMHDSSQKNEEIAFAAYGPSRLLSSNCKLSISDDELLERSKPWYSIFNPDGILRALDDILKVTSPKSENRLIDMINFLMEMFNQKEDSTSNDSKSELIPQLAEVDFYNLMGGGEIFYREKDNSNIPYKNLTKFDDLASGIRSLLALVGDLIIRLIERNPDAPDPSNFRAVVLIDEIDIHFHPSMQKKIIEVLAGNFPKVQFIVTTHSPVTLLGAPENSVFFKVSRNVETGIVAERLEIDIKDLLPNSILSSPIFGFHDIFQTTHKADTKVRTEKLYSDIIKNDELKATLKDIAKDLKSKR